MRDSLYTLGAFQLSLYIRIKWRLTFLIHDKRDQMPSVQFFLSDCQTVFWNESNILKGVKILIIYQMMFSLKKYLVLISQWRMD